MKKYYPLQALLALAGLGLLIGLPALDRKTPSLGQMMSQTQNGSCFVTSPLPLNSEKPVTIMARLRTHQLPDTRKAERNMLPSSASALDARARHSLRQCV